MADPNVIELERRLQSMGYEMVRLAAEVTRLAQQLPLAFGGGAQPEGGGDGKLYFAIGDGTAHVATGTWPSLSVATFTSDTYDMSSGSQVLVDSGATIRLWFKDAMSTTAGKLIICAKNADGTYTAIDESCTKVT